MWHRIAHSTAQHCVSETVREMLRVGKSCSCSICVLEVEKNNNNNSAVDQWRKWEFPNGKGEGQTTEESISSLLSVVLWAHLQSVCIRSLSNSSLEAFSSLLCSVFLFAVPPLPLSLVPSCLPFSGCPFIRTLVKFFPHLRTFLPLPYLSLLSVSLYLFHPSHFLSPSLFLSSFITVQPAPLSAVIHIYFCHFVSSFLSLNAALRLSFYSFFSLLVFEILYTSFAHCLTWYRVGCFLDFLCMNSSPGRG